MNKLELHQLALMARLYYREGRTQDEIGHYLGLSRMKVIRGLREAKDRGIIRFEIEAGLLSLASLELELREAFHIDSVTVVATPSASEAMACVAEVGAEYLEKNIRSGAVVGVTWGPPVRETVTALRRQAGKPITVVELIGGVKFNPGASGHATALGLAQAYESERNCHLLECPAIVRNPDLRGLLLSEPPMRATMEVIRAADTAIFSTSDLKLAMGLLEAGYISNDDLDALRRAGAVGNIYARFFDREGVECDTPLRERTMGLGFEEIRSIRQKICITCGTDKVEPVRAALRGRLIDVLITDEATATALLSQQ